MQDESNYEQVGKYRLLKKLATGGMAHIYLAEQSGLGGFKKRLVIKRILPHLIDDNKFLQMFQDEARVAAMMNHPNIVQIFELGESDNNYYIAMEYVAGYNLRAIIQMSNDHGIWLAPEYIAKLGSQICEGLEYAHNFCDDDGNHLNIIHRDISPQNIILSNQGIIKIVDFGIAKAKSNAQETQAGIIKGKLAYMSPEQVKGQPLDRRSDLFSLGIVLYELATHQRPYQGKSDIDMLRAILESSPVKIETMRPDFPPQFTQIIYKALAKNREDRYPSARELQWDLEQFVQSTGKAVTTFQLRELVTRLEQLDQNRDKEEEPASSGSGSGSQSVPPQTATPAATASTPPVATAQATARPAARPAMPPPPPAFPGQQPGTHPPIPASAKGPGDPQDFDEDGETMWATNVKLPSKPPVATASSSAGANVVAHANMTGRPMSAPLTTPAMSAPHTTPAMGLPTPGGYAAPPLPTIQPAPTAPAQVSPPAFPSVLGGYQTPAHYAQQEAYPASVAPVYAETGYAQPSVSSSSSEWEEGEATVLSHSPVNNNDFGTGVPSGMMAPAASAPTPAYGGLGHRDLDTIVEPSLRPSQSNLPGASQGVAPEILNNYLPSAPPSPPVAGSGSYHAHPRPMNYNQPGHSGNGMHTGTDAATILDQPSLSSIGMRGPQSTHASPFVPNPNSPAAANRNWPPAAVSASPPLPEYHPQRKAAVTQAYTFPSKRKTFVWWLLLGILILGGAGALVYFFVLN